jgi:hypothetical protein
MADRMALQRYLSNPSNKHAFRGRRPLTSAHLHYRLSTNWTFVPLTHSSQQSLSSSWKQVLSFISQSAVTRNPRVPSNAAFPPPAANAEATNGSVHSPATTGRDPTERDPAGQTGPHDAYLCVAIGRPGRYILSYVE